MAALTNRNPQNFVTPAAAQPAQTTQLNTLAPVQPIAPRALLDSQNRLIDLYGQQFKQAAVSGEVVGDNDQHVSYRLSTANELEQRRRTARMYLLFLAGVNAMATTGVVVLAYLSHMTSGAAQTLADLSPEVSPVEVRAKLALLRTLFLVHPRR